MHRNRLAWCFVLIGVACPLAIAHDGGGGSDAAASGGGSTGPYPSLNMNLLSHLPLADMGVPSGLLGNDIWGWTDSATSREYALFGHMAGTSFVDITDPHNPKYLGMLPTHAGTSATIWRDVKVRGNYAFVVSDSTSTHPHGMQVFDLTNLRGVTSPQTFSETAHYSGITKAHNIAINETTGYAYIVGSDQASGGLHIVDINDPLHPVAAGNFSADGYTHDTQVVNYVGPDTDHAGREIAFNANEDTLTIVDVTNKSSTLQLSRTGYPQSAYAHQGWLTEDQRFFLMDDELDENGSIGTRTHIWDVQDLDNPAYLGFYSGSTTSRDHNLYVHDGLVFEANYTSGLRVLRPTSAFGTSTTDPQLEEIAFFDTYPADDGTSFNGAWSVYPFFESGSIIVSDRQSGLFVLSMSTAVPEPGSATLVAWGIAFLLLYRHRH